MIMLIVVISDSYILKTTLNIGVERGLCVCGSTHWWVVMMGEWEMATDGCRTNFWK